MPFVPFCRLLAVLATALILTGPAFAADWVAVRLRGEVEVLAAGTWVPLKRGDIVANNQMIRTLANGHAELHRDNEVVTLGSNTEIRIEDDADTGYTTVLQDSGRLEVDAEARHVKHFEVQTPYLAAVVKGTHFIVTADSEGASVSVDRGSVSVQSVATDRSTTIGVGQIATVKRKSDLVVSGLGPWPPVLDPGVSRPKVAASLGGALGSAPASRSDSADGPTPATLSPQGGNGGTGGVQIVAASTSTALFGGGATASSRSTAKAEPSQPVSLGVVLLGAVVGAALGGLALLFRRGF